MPQPRTGALKQAAARVQQPGWGSKQNGGTGSSTAASQAAGGAGRAQGVEAEEGRDRHGVGRLCVWRGKQARGWGQLVGSRGGACKINKRGGGSAGGAGGSGSSRLGGWRAGGGAACGRRGRHAQQHAAGKAAHAGQGRVGAAGWSGLLLGLLCSTKVSSMPRRADLPNAPQPCRRRSPPAPAGEQWRGGTMQQVSPETQTSRGRAQALHKQAHDTSSGMQESPSSGWKKNRTKCGQRQRCRKKRQKAGRGRSM